MGSSKKTAETTCMNEKARTKLCGNDEKLDSMTLGKRIAPFHRQYKVFRQGRPGGKQERTESRKLEGRKDFAVRGRAVYCSNG